jgi:hypothetical protein
MFHKEVDKSLCVKNSSWFKLSLPKKFINKKTLNVYTALFLARDATNLRTNLSYVVYENAKGEKFVREFREFIEKFEVMSHE